MADEFDGCECVWSHEFAMQRLLAFIRQNQNACTDTECIDVSGRVAQSPTGSGGGDNSFVFTIVLLMIAMFMYVANPSTWRRHLTPPTKPSSRRHDHDDDGHQDGAPPPPPPPAIN